ncbi:MAG TPA: hypothetical protein VGW78_03620 [Candidatus Babeliales bacterium]|nr:hypothetical protein [Candidatus Babeliales bacterium]
MTHAQRFLIYVSIVLPTHQMIYAHNQVQHQKDPVIVCIRTMPFAEINQLYKMVFTEKDTINNSTELGIDNKYIIAINRIIQILATAKHKYRKKIRKAIQESYHEYDMNTAECLLCFLALPLAPFVLIEYYDRIKKVDAERALLAKSLNFTIEDWLLSQKVD